MSNHAQVMRIEGCRQRIYLSPYNSKTTSFNKWYIAGRQISSLNIWLSYLFRKIYFHYSTVVQYILSRLIVNEFSIFFSCVQHNVCYFQYVHFIWLKWTHIQGKCMHSQDIDVRGYFASQVSFLRLCSTEAIWLKFCHSLK